MLCFRFVSQQRTSADPAPLATEQEGEHDMGTSATDTPAITALVMGMDTSEVASFPPE